MGETIFSLTVKSKESKKRGLSPRGGETLLAGCFLLLEVDNRKCNAQ